MIHWLVGFSVLAVLGKTLWWLSRSKSKEDLKVQDTVLPWQPTAINALFSELELKALLAIADTAKKEEFSYGEWNTLLWLDEGLRDYGMKLWCNEYHTRMLQNMLLAQGIRKKPAPPELVTEVFDYAKWQAGARAEFLRAGTWFPVEKISPVVHKNGLAVKYRRDGKLKRALVTETNRLHHLRLVKD